MTQTQVQTTKRNIKGTIPQLIHTKKRNKTLKKCLKEYEIKLYEKVLYNPNTFSIMSITYVNYPYTTGESINTQEDLDYYLGLKNFTNPKLHIDLKNKINGSEITISILMDEKTVIFPDFVDNSLNGKLWKKLTFNNFFREFKIDLKWDDIIIECPTTEVKNEKITLKEKFSKFFGF